MVNDGSGEALAQVAQRDETFKGRLNRSWSKPGPVKGVPAHCRRAGLDAL